jgi:replicative DNA helicase
MLDRLPPHSTEAEQGVLGCCLTDPKALDETIVSLGDNINAFYDLRHQTIFNVLVQMRSDMQPVSDLIAVCDKLKDMQLLEQVGGVTYISQVQDVPSAANLPYYLEIIREKYLLRLLLTTCSGAVGKAYDNLGTVEDFIGETERAVLAVRQTFSRGRGTVDLSSIQQKLIAAYEQAMTGTVAGLTTDFRDLDYRLGGCMPQEMIVIGGTPSAGKTTLAMNIAYNIAVRGEIVSLKSLETSASKLVHRLQCYAGKVDSSGFLRGQATESEMHKMIRAVSMVSAQKERLIISDEAMTDTQLVASCRQDYQNGARLFVIDMLQNIQAKGDSDFAIVTAASKCVKNIAKELNVPVIVTSALSRMETDKSGKVRRPSMHDLRQSGQIESDADKIVLLHCPEREGDLRQVTGIIAKNKDGPLGDVNFTFFANQFRMESAQVGDNPEPRETKPPHAD